MLLSSLIAFFLKVFYLFVSAEDATTLSEAIRETWQNETLELCSDPIKNFAGDSLFSYRFQNNFEWINIEVRNIKPLLIRFVGFIPPHSVQRFQNLHDNLELEDQKVVGGKDDSYVSKSRQAKGHWTSKDDKNMSEIYQKFSTVLTIDPMISESILILSYDKNDHYAPHFDFLDFQPDSKDWWYVNYGDRLATALFIIKTAEKGGGTVFPTMNIVISPEPGDMILWFNANMKFEREDLSFHGACPILAGRKIAMSLWIRCRYQKDLRCHMDDKYLSHQLNDIIRT